MDDAVGVAGVVAGTRNRFAAEPPPRPAKAVADAVGALAASARQQPIRTILIAAACGALLVALFGRFAIPRDARPRG